jgi:hypothetical protein
VWTDSRVTACGSVTFQRLTVALATKVVSVSPSGENAMAMCVSEPPCVDTMSPALRYTWAESRILSRR